MKHKVLFAGSLLLFVVFGGYVIAQECSIVGQEWNGYWFGPGWQLNKCDPGFPLPPGIIVEKKRPC